MGFSVACNKGRFEFLRQLLDLMPDAELKGVKELVVKAVRRRKRKYNDENDSSKTSVPVPILGIVPVPVPVVDPMRNGWYRNFKKNQFVSIDVEKVIN
jgi:hypothetical protein